MCFILNAYLDLGFESEWLSLHSELSESNLERLFQLFITEFNLKEKTDVKVTIHPHMVTKTKKSDSKLAPILICDKCNIKIDSEFVYHCKQGCDFDICTKCLNKWDAWDEKDM